MAVEFKYRHRIITDIELAFVRRLISQNPTASRRRLSQLLCQAWNWVQPNGVPCDMVCRGLMLAMHRAGMIELPPVRQVNHNPLATRSKPKPVTVDTSALCSRLGQIQPLSFVQVRRTKAEAIFNLRVPATGLPIGSWWAERPVVAIRIRPRNPTGLLKRFWSIRYQDDSVVYCASSYEQEIQKTS